MGRKRNIGQENLKNMEQEKDKKKGAAKIKKLWSRKRFKNMEQEKDNWPSYDPATTCPPFVRTTPSDLTTFTTFYGMRVRENSLDHGNYPIKQKMLFQTAQYSAI